MAESIPPPGGAGEPQYNDRPLGEWLRFLGDTRKHVQTFALEGLAEIGPEAIAAIPALTAVLRGKHADLREPAAVLLARLGAPAVPPLLAALQAPDEGVRRAAAVGLGQMGPAARPALAALQQTLGDASAGVRVKAAGAVWAVAQDAGAAVPALIAVLKSESTAAAWQVRHEATADLVKIGAPARAALQAIKDDPSENVRRAARNALRQIGSDDADEAEDETAEDTEASQGATKEPPINSTWLVGLVLLTVLAAFRARGLFELLVVYWGVYVYETLYHCVTALAAWRSGLVVETVTVGTGPTIARFRYLGTEWRFRLIPVSGEILWYAKTPRAADDPYETLSLWYNVAFEVVALLSQLGLAVLILAGSWWVGRADPAYISGPAQVGWVRPGSALDRAGLRRGDVIRMVQHDGAMMSVPSWRDLVWAIHGAAGPTRLEVERGGQTLTLDADLDRPALLDMQHEMPPKVVSVAAKSAASRLGIKVGDEIVAVDGKPTPHGLDMRLALAIPEGGTPVPHTLSVRRKDQTLDFTVQPTDLEKGTIGLRWKADRGPRVALGLGDSFAEAFKEVGETWRQVWHWLTGQREFSRGYEQASAETDLRRPFFIAPEGFDSRLPVLLGLMGVLFTMYYLVSLLGTVALAIVERVQKRSVSERLSTIVEWSILGAIGLWVAYRVLV
ncbi:hypothetical protein AYO44_14495 [Planctomycetaceae bacterium SCGC AG-212-F19]|nr:hypothetical protein AYO44_14495 [Planctomycetaceae bacterium SCGC AG-212-F19]